MMAGKIASAALSLKRVDKIQSGRRRRRFFNAADGRGGMFEWPAAEKRVKQVF